MCIPALTALFPALGGATAAGATAAGATAGAALQTVGTALAIGGGLYQGIQSYRAGRENAALIERQRQTEAQLSAVRDQRTRAQFNSAIRRQTAELAARGISLDSPTALLLGHTAAREMSFESQAVRSGAAARDLELGSAARMARASATSGLLRGVTSAAGVALRQAPDLWPELMA